MFYNHMPKYRSGFEKLVGARLSLLKASFKYEATKIPYTLEATYTPDFCLPNGIMLEAKGYLRPSDRKKMLAVKEQHPKLDIRFIFQAPNNPISKGSKTTYARWAEKHGFKWAAMPPKEWLK